MVTHFTLSLVNSPLGQEEHLWLVQWSLDKWEFVPPLKNLEGQVSDLIFLQPRVNHFPPLIETPRANLLAAGHSLIVQIFR